MGILLGIVTIFQAYRQEKKADEQKCPAVLYNSLLNNFFNYTSVHQSSSPKSKFLKVGEITCDVCTHFDAYSNC